MRVRVWINGADGPSHDFELVSIPRVGERVSIAAAHGVEEGIVDTVTWQLQPAAASGGDFALDSDPPGSVSLVQVVCRPAASVVRGAFAAAELDEAAPAGSA